MTKDLTPDELEAIALILGLKPKVSSALPPSTGTPSFEESFFWHIVSGPVECYIEERDVANWQEGYNEFDEAYKATIAIRFACKTAVAWYWRDSQDSQPDEVSEHLDFDVDRVSRSDFLKQLKELYAKRSTA
jgi:hypothetical protein